MVKHAPLAEEEGEEGLLIHCFHPVCRSLPFSSLHILYIISSAGLNISSHLDSCIASSACFDTNIKGTEDCCFLN